MAFFNSAVTVLQTLVIALGAGLGIWGAINLLEGYGNDNVHASLLPRYRGAAPIQWAVIDGEEIGRAHV